MLNTLLSKFERYGAGNFEHKSSLTTSFPALIEQKPVLADTSTKIRLAILGTAMVDALGGPAEFQSRFSFALVTSMLPNENFGLGRGVWTDDTSMTLCLARSLATFVPDTANSPNAKGGFDLKHQLDAYLSWYQRGELSAISRCFDIGTATECALSIYEREIGQGGVSVALESIKDKLGNDRSSGNGSLMRVVPIGLAYWRNEGKALEYARLSSVATHPNALCQDACAVWTGAIVRILQRSQLGQEEKPYTKLDLLDYFVNFPYRASKLREALSLPSDAGVVPSDGKKREAFYRIHHPILALIDKHQSQASTKDNWVHLLPSEGDLSSSGYVLHSIVAALYCFLASKSFEEGAILAVNLGSDADTVGAIYGGLAGAWYGTVVKPKKDDSFWQEGVQKWRKDLVKRDMVEKVADELVQFEQQLGKDSI